MSRTCTVGAGVIALGLAERTFVGCCTNEECAALAAAGLIVYDAVAAVRGVALWSVAVNVNVPACVPLQPAKVTELPFAAIDFGFAVQPNPTSEVESRTLRLVVVLVVLPRES